MVQSSPEFEYLRAAEDLAKARVRYAESFLLHRSRLGRDGTDKQAEAHAVAATKDEVTWLQARLRVAEAKL